MSEEWRKSVRILPTLLAIVLACGACFSSAAPMSPTDLFQPPCGSLLADPPATGYKLWSNAATWPSGVVPGVGTALWVNVSIPCNTAVLLDVPEIKLNVLSIRGLLRVQDSVILPNITVQASFIIVEGQLSAGTATQHFSQKLTFLLLPNPNNRLGYNFCVDFPGTCNAPADIANPRALGHKTFAVVGGQLRLYGLPSGKSDMLIYTKLSKSASSGDLIIYVEKDITNWGVGSSFVIGATDYYPDQAEVFTIGASVLQANGQTKVYLSKSLRYNHFGDPLGVPDGFGGFVDERAEIALLERNIVITGLDEPIPLNYEGGHFMIFHTPTPQYIEGVKFWRMGQQGTLGRYSIHFHISGSHRDTILRKNLVQDSKQRCVVIHTTFNLTVDTNVAYNTSGHCFITEEGGEISNTFIRNLGMRTRSADRIIPPSTSVFGTVSESDGSPSTFWMSNPNNNYIDNIAGGSDNSGYWFELRQNVRGNTVTFPPYNNTVPQMQPLGIFTGNVAHSNRGPGLRFYPNGYRPRFNATVLGTQWWAANPSAAVFVNLTVWKNPGEGVFIHNSDYLNFFNSTFADNRIGVSSNLNNNITVVNSRFVGLSNNIGTATQCTNSPWLCGPLGSSCEFPLAEGQIGRSQGWNNWKNPLMGFAADVNHIFDPSDQPKVVDNCRFHSYDTTCRPAAAIMLGLNAGPRNWASASSSFSGLQVSPGTNPIYLPPINFTFPDGGQFLGGEAAKMYLLQDRDGSLVGGKGGYVVSANAPAILPPANRLPCTLMPAWNAYACPNVCYRTVEIYYDEPGFKGPLAGQQGARSLKDFSYLMIRRLEDNSQLQLEGNLRWMETSGPTRYFVFSVVAGTTYEINFGGSKTNPRFQPDSFQIQFRDTVYNCNQGITFRIMSNKYQWIFKDQTNSLTLSPCAGVQLTTNLTYSYVCHKQKSTMQLRMNAAYRDVATIYRSTQSIPPCQLTYKCGILPSGSIWLYDISGAELHPIYPGATGFMNTIYNTSGWLSGKGLIGWAAYQYWPLSTWTPKPVMSTPSFQTIYFRNNFSIVNSACATGLYLDLVVRTGVVVYLNNVEILRVNLPSGNISAITRSLSDPALPDRWYTTFFVPLNTSAPFSLVDGTNYLAAEIKTCPWDWCADMFFDLRVWASMTGAWCRGPTVNPEICDGLDNDNDGTVDIDPSTNAVFQRPCSTTCGSGIETCSTGSYKGCTAPKSYTEICNGKDDDCDGLIDNGPKQLDCADGLVCYAGKCQQRTTLSVATTVVPKNATNWYYTATGENLPQSYPNWTIAEDLLLSPKSFIVKLGNAPFGTKYYATQSGFSGTLLPYMDSGLITNYFIRSFNLTAADVANTQSIMATTKRDDGAVVYVNGKELFRTGMPSGPILTGTLATGGQDLSFYYGNFPFTNTSTFLKEGVNWLAAELHQQHFWGDRDGFFDLDLIRNVYSSCSVLPGSPTTCVRNPPADTPLFTAGSRWAYSDASQPIPPINWISPSFDDSAWPTGNTPLGAGSWWQFKTNIVSGAALNNSRMAYYFRKTINVPDGACYFNLTFSSWTTEGAVVYLNGVEVYRYNMPSTAPFPLKLVPIFPTTLALNNWDRGWQYTSISGGSLKQGLNTIAVEVHHSANVGNIVLDMSLAGQREGVNCPVPLL